jgi:molybdenum cofactor cytidylyltransferase
MKIAGIILAAGKGSRMGGGKMTALLHDKALVRHVADAAVASKLDPVIAVLGHDADHVAKALDGTGVRIIHNSDFAEGMATSLKAGIAALPAKIDAALILLGDMPQITLLIIRQLLDAFHANPYAAAIVPMVGNQRGNPILISRKLFQQVMTLEGDVGARKLLAKAGDAVVEIIIDDAAVLTDVDTLDALEQLNFRFTLPR